MINSVEFVLMFLSMFSSITPENLAAVGFLFGLALEYDAMDLWAAMTEHGMYGQVMSMIEPLSALAECAGYDMKHKNKHKLTVTEAYDMLREIVDPILGRLDLAEIEQIRYTAISGGDVLQLPLDELRALVNNWTQHAREDDDKYARFGKLPAAGSVGCASESGSMDASGTSSPNDRPGGKRRMAGMDEAVKEGPDNRQIAEKVEGWSKMKMDDRTAAAIVGYCKEYAAPPTETTLGRRRRVEKRERLGWDLGFHETSGRRRGWDTGATTRDERPRSYGSYSTESSGMCIGFSPSGRTQMVCTKPQNIRPAELSDEHRRKWGEEETRVGTEGHREPSTEGSRGVGGGGCVEMDTRKDQDARMAMIPTEYTNEEYMDLNTPQMIDDSCSLTKSSSMDTIDILMDCPPLVGYYMRREEYLTKHGWPSPPSTPNSSLPRSPFPGLTIEQVYSGYANSWDVEQNWLWRRALRDPGRQYVGDAMLEWEAEIDGEPGLEPKRNLFARTVEAVCRKFRGLLRH